MPFVPIRLCRTSFIRKTLSEMPGAALGEDYVGGNGEMKTLKELEETLKRYKPYAKGLNYETFVNSEMIVDAVLRNLEIIGEASGNIPESVREKYPDIPWKRMIGLRNIAIHEYFGVDLGIIWEIITRNLPETKPMITEMLKGLGEGKE